MQAAGTRMPDLKALRCQNAASMKTTQQHKAPPWMHYVKIEQGVMPARLFNYRTMTLTLASQTLEMVQGWLEVENYVMGSSRSQDWH